MSKKGKNHNLIGIRRKNTTDEQRENNIFDFEFKIHPKI